jgi:crotonobetainyl-CoA:carnitine CoA-transferase CaiB-like acyl-CoA transferase
MDRRLTSLLSYQYTGENPGPEDPRPVGILPSGIFSCKDGYVDIRCTMRWWPRLVAMMDMPELHDDPRFHTENARLDTTHREAFLQLFRAWLLPQTRQEVMAKARRHRLPGTAINTPAEVLHDAHFGHRGTFVSVTHPIAGTWQFPGAPFRPQQTPWQVRQPAPLLGQHTAAVLREFLGFSEAQVTELRQTNVI